MLEQTSHVSNYGQKVDLNRVFLISEQFIQSIELKIINDKVGP